jgi:hypothetical protein
MFWRYTSSVATTKQGALSLVLLLHDKEPGCIRKYVDKETTMANLLDIPTDTPWPRICVSEDLLDLLPCDNEYPSRWRSSLTVFRYDPEVEYQPSDGYVVSHLMVVAPITPFAPEIGIDVGSEYVPPELIVELEDAPPATGRSCMLQ